MNQYSTNNLALSKAGHQEERDRKRYLSYKFSLTPLSEFKWNGSIYGNRQLCEATMKNTLTQLEASIPTAFLHQNWHSQRHSWLKAVQMCQKPRDFALALAILECSIKPVLFTTAYHDILGKGRHQNIREIPYLYIVKRDRGRG